MPSSTAYNLLEACRAAGCPVCRLEARAIERYLDRKFYENVNTPAWRDHLRASLGFCHEHAWLGVNRRLGDALGFSIIYRDIVNSVLKQLRDKGEPAHASRKWTSSLQKIPEQTRNMIARLLTALTPRKRCPVCEHRDEMTRSVLSVLVDELEKPQMRDALEASEGLCLPHLRMALEHIKDVSVSEILLNIHREKLEDLSAELGEFIRKNDYQAIKEGFGSEGNAWLRAVGMVAGSRKEN
ncbi:MAG TPA: DUF6062 family protein [Anaerolineales bacterium]|nr:DUF6062 family protein [Anaerolineales bacterium]